MSDPRDIALLNSFPVVAVPKYDAFEPLSNDGQRLLVAGNGFFLELRRSWLYAIERCAQRDGAIRYPFGEIKPGLSLNIGADIAPLIEAFVAIARNRLPDECAAVGVYEHATAHCVIEECEAVNASAAHVTYMPPRLLANENIAVDLHSHGVLPAFFSEQDDADDIAAVKLAICVGRLHRVKPVVCARLCLNGLFVPILLNAYGVYALDEHGSTDELYP